MQRDVRKFQEPGYMGDFETVTTELQFPEITADIGPENPIEVKSSTRMGDGYTPHTRIEVGNFFRSILASPRTIEQLSLADHLQVTTIDFFKKSDGSFVAQLVFYASSDEAWKNDADDVNHFIDSFTKELNKSRLLTGKKTSTTLADMFYHAAQNAHIKYPSQLSITVVLNRLNPEVAKTKAVGCVYFSTKKPGEREFSFEPKVKTPHSYLITPEMIYSVKRETKSVAGGEHSETVETKPVSFTGHIKDLIAEILPKVPDFFIDELLFPNRPKNAQGIVVRPGPDYERPDNAGLLALLSKCNTPLPSGMSPLEIVKEFLNPATKAPSAYSTVSVNWGKHSVNLLTVVDQGDRSYTKIDLLHDSQAVRLSHLRDVSQLTLVSNSYALGQTLEIQSHPVPILEAKSNPGPGMDVKHVSGIAALAKQAEQQRQLLLKLWAEEQFKPWLHLIKHLHEFQKAIDSRGVDPLKARELGLIYVRLLAARPDHLWPLEKALEMTQLNPHQEVKKLTTEQKQQIVNEWKQAETRSEKQLSWLQAFNFLYPHAALHTPGLVCVMFNEPMAHAHRIRSKVAVTKLADGKSDAKSLPLTSISRMTVNLKPDQKAISFTYTPLGQKKLATDFVRECLYIQRGDRPFSVKLQMIFSPHFEPDSEWLTENLDVPENVLTQLQELILSNGRKLREIFIGTDRDNIDIESDDDTSFNDVFYPWIKEILTQKSFTQIKGSIMICIFFQGKGPSEERRVVVNVGPGIVVNSAWHSNLLLPGVFDRNLQPVGLHSLSEVDDPSAILSSRTRCHQETIQFQECTESAVMLIPASLLDRNQYEMSGSGTTAFHQRTLATFNIGAFTRNSHCSLDVFQRTLKEKRGIFFHLLEGLGTVDKQKIAHTKLAYAKLNKLFTTADIPLNDEKQKDEFKRERERILSMDLLNIHNKTIDLFIQEIDKLIKYTKEPEQYQINQKEKLALQTLCAYVFMNFGPYFPDPSVERAFNWKHLRTQCFTYMEGRLPEDLPIIYSNNEQLPQPKISEVCIALADKYYAKCFKEIDSLTLQDQSKPRSASQIEELKSKTSKIRTRAEEIKSFANAVGEQGSRIRELNYIARHLEQLLSKNFKGTDREFWREFLDTLIISCPLPSLYDWISDPQIKYSWVIQELDKIIAQSAPLTSGGQYVFLAGGSASSSSGPGPASKYEHRPR